MADVSPCGAANHIAVRRGHWPVRLYLVLGRTRALQPGDRIRQHLAARVAGADNDRDETGYLCAWNVDQRRILSRDLLGADRHSCAPGATTASRVGRWQGNGVESVSCANLTGIGWHMAGHEQALMANLSALSPPEFDAHFLRRSFEVAR